MFQDHDLSMASSVDPIRVIRHNTRQLHEEEKDFAIDEDEIETMLMGLAGPPSTITPRSGASTSTTSRKPQQSNSTRKSKDQLRLELLENKRRAEHSRKAPIERHILLRRQVREMTAVTRKEFGVGSIESKDIGLVNSRHQRTPPDAMCEEHEDRGSWSSLEDLDFTGQNGSVKQLNPRDVQAWLDAPSFLV